MVVEKISSLSAVLMFSVLFAIPLFGQPAATAQETASAKIVWTKQPGVNRYRLQVAADAQFQDVLFDRLVEGDEYVVRDLNPGNYFWRVAPQTGPTAGVFLKPIPFEAKQTRAVAAPTKPETPNQPPSSVDNKTRTRLAIPGWSVATGQIVRLMSAKLRPGTTTDFVGVNSEGRVYALDGARGIALWTAAFRLSAQVDQRVRSHDNQFGPLIISNPGTALRVLVAFDAGVRALDGPTGREIWSTKIAGRPSTGTVIGTDIYLVAEKADKLLVLDAVTGQLKSQMTLRDEAVGPPVLLVGTQGRQLLIPLKAGLIELRTLDGEYLRSFRTGADVTTQPVVVTSSRGEVLLLGLKNGLAAFDASTVEPLGRIAIEGNDYPVGSLSVVDLNGDKLSDVIMTTNGGRVIAVDVADGKIRWSTEVGYVSTPAFADLDADARPDLIVPGKSNFAVGLSGISGSVIWESGDEPSIEKMTNVETRSLAVATVTDGRLIVVGTDRSAAGLRAFEVPKSSAKSNP
jgi:outer membrane protein assembly factor BamB